ncbi:MAG: putative dsRNA-binding protein [Candidatus Poribacteria bacterium]|nr:putative dsRNA-binding protein [Candidatus Poribacteria bacterium]
MADLATGEILENYKGLLIQYCQERGLSQPTYTETQHGPADAPSWQVTVAYADRIYETPEPVPGSKRFAHQTAAQQVLAEIDSRRENFLAGDTAESLLTLPVPRPAPTDATPTALKVPISLVSNALTIANERLTTSQPTRYRTLTDAEFSQKLSKLTLEIVRNLLETAEQQQITFQ